MSPIHSSRSFEVQSLTGNSIDVCSFRTAIGWLAILGQRKTVAAVFVGHPSMSSVNQSVEKYASRLGREVKASDWFFELREQFIAFAEGRVVDFSGIQLESTPRTRFQQQILERTRRIPYGETTTYGELAASVGHPGAARAVGTVMSTNRFPIIIPCHRVLAAGGKLGGYTAPSGLVLKRKLLEIERTHRSRVSPQTE